jgi:NAD(P)-dependent dehydrogenase (short-subunit alcohol dehydrogenase family)
MKIDFTNKTTLVVGGSAGIGLKIKEEFQNLGSKVLSISRKEGVDINDTKQVDEFLLQVDKVDFLINVASINYTKKIQEIDLNEWQEVINTNLNSIFYITKQCIEKMESGSKIVNFSSIAGRNRSLVSGVHYTTSKAGIIGFTRQLAYELGPKNINVNCVCPSQTLTNMLQNSMTSEQQEKLSSEIPLRRLATVEDQVGPVIFLCSELSSYINGAVIDVNGGQI